MFRLVIILIFCFLLVPLINTVSAEEVAPGYKFHARWPGYPCGDAPITDHFAGTETEMTYTAPPGGVVTGVCFFTTKSLHNGPVTEDKTFFYGCFTVKGIGTQTVTVIRNNVDKNCSGNLSHMDVYGTGLAKVAPVKSPVPSPSPEVSPSPSSEPTPSLEPSPSATAEVEMTTEETQPVWWKRIVPSVIGWFQQWFTR
ncbi:MAG TPA: hypothetical protein VF209_03975 [Patescibacteria group bacterium]